jgi:outer membrane protein TolC
VFFRKSVLMFALFWAAPALAQTTTPISLEEAERRALDKNPQIAQARLETAAADYSIAQGKAAYSPSLSVSLAQRSQTNPATSQLAGGQTQVTNEALSYSTGLSQQLPWGGGRLSVDFTGNRNATSNLFSTYNPSFSSSITASVTQPLLGGFKFDQTRAQIEQADITRTIADVQLRQQMARTLNAVRHAYWELVYAMDALETARRSEELARRQLEDNRLRVELGTVAQIDIVESEAEVASRHQTTIKAEGAFRITQVALKQLMVADTSDPLWASTLQPVDRPLQGSRVIDVRQAITIAVANRTDLTVARKQSQVSDTSLKLLNEQRKPAVDLVASYSASGVGGTQVLRSSGALGSEIIGTVPGGYLDVLRSIGALDYPTWSVGVNVTMPLGKKASDAAYARGQVEKRQAELQIDTLELQAAAAVTRAAEAVRTAEEQVQAAAAGRQLAQKRLEAEQARRTAGLSTTFLVSQAQRDLATAETAELRALLDYRTAIADFELAQEAP